jgi:DNA-directed RNA polymerase subunit F
MTDNEEKDKQLLENLEKVLAGSENEITGSLDDDTRTALDFARKMASLRETPSKEFKENLKAELVHRLAEQEKKDLHADQTLLFWGVPRRKLWQ